MRELRGFIYKNILLDKAEKKHVIGFNFHGKEKSVNYLLDVNKNKKEGLLNFKEKIRSSLVKNELIKKKKNSEEFFVTPLAVGKFNNKLKLKEEFFLLPGIFAFYKRDFHIKYYKINDLNLADKEDLYSYVYKFNNTFFYYNKNKGETKRNFNIRFKANFFFKLRLDVNLPKFMIYNTYNFFFLEPDYLNNFSKIIVKPRILINLKKITRMKLRVNKNAFTLTNLKKKIRFNNRRLTIGSLNYHENYYFVKRHYFSDLINLGMQKKNLIRVDNQNFWYHNYLRSVSRNYYIKGPIKILPDLYDINNKKTKRRSYRFQKTSPKKKERSVYKNIHSHIAAPYEDFYSLKRLKLGYFCFFHEDFVDWQFCKKDFPFDNKLKMKKKKNVLLSNLDQSRSGNFFYWIIVFLIKERNKFRFWRIPYYYFNDFFYGFSDFKEESFNFLLKLYSKVHFHFDKFYFFRDLPKDKIQAKNFGLVFKKKKKEIPMNLIIIPEIKNPAKKFLKNLNFLETFLQDFYSSGNYIYNLKKIVRGNFYKFFFRRIKFIWNFLGNAFYPARHYIRLVVLTYFFAEIFIYLDLFYFEETYLFGEKWEWEKIHIYEGKFIDLRSIKK